MVKEEDDFKLPQFKRSAEFYCIASVCGSKSFSPSQRMLDPNNTNYIISLYVHAIDFSLNK